MGYCATEKTKRIQPLYYKNDLPFVVGPTSPNEMHIIFTIHLNIITLITLVAIANEL